MKFAVGNAQKTFSDCGVNENLRCERHALLRGVTDVGAVWCKK